MGNFPQNSQILQCGPMWDYASLTYDTLSIVSKGLLALMFVKLITNNNCIDTYDGQACLY